MQWPRDAKLTSARTQPLPQRPLDGSALCHPVDVSTASSWRNKPWVKIPREVKSISNLLLNKRRPSFWDFFVGPGERVADGHRQMQSGRQASYPSTLSRKSVTYWAMACRASATKRPAWLPTLPELSEPSALLAFASSTAASMKLAGIFIRTFFGRS